jgi:glycosyltransferase involved in cell wall biosynthesis
LKKVFLLADPRSHVVNQHSVLSRHEKYAQELSLSSGDSTCLCILSFGFKGDVTVTKHGHIWLLYFPLNFLNIFTNLALIKRNLAEIGIVGLLISGDPWLGALSVYGLRKVLFKNAAIEVQIHADIGERAWRQINLRNRIKYRVATLTLSMADQVRCVSATQAHKIYSHLQSLESKIVVIPIASALEVERAHYDVKTDKPLSIGFVGRIHKDRGLKYFVEVIRKLNIKRQDFSVVIAGTGPDSKEFLTELEDIIGANRIHNFFEVRPEDMDMVWKQIGILLSCPQAESFGRSLREAIAHEVPIWITPTSGGLDFSATLKPGYFQIISSPLEIEIIAEQYHSLSEISIDVETINAVIKDNGSYIRKLVDSWLALSENRCYRDNEEI